MNGFRTIRNEEVVALLLTTAVTIGGVAEISRKRGKLKGQLS
jgi:hypothetical protein